jgi:hypothetical protein
VERAKDLEKKNPAALTPLVANSHQRSEGLIWIGVWIIIVIV